MLTNCYCLSTILKMFWVNRKWSHLNNVRRNDMSRTENLFECEFLFDLFLKHKDHSTGLGHKLLGGFVAESKNKWHLKCFIFLFLELGCLYVSKRSIEWTMRPFSILCGQRFNKFHLAFIKSTILPLLFICYVIVVVCEPSKSVAERFVILWASRAEL